MLFEAPSKKETLAQVFSCEFCEIFKSTFFTEHLQATASISFKSVKKSEVFFHWVLKWNMVWNKLIKGEPDLPSDC